MNYLLKRNVSPTRIIALSFFAVILIGSLLLSLPVSTYTSVSYIDHLFTSVSATCVTGLVTLTVCDTYTIFGQIVILLMIQIGGLGFLTLLSMFLVKFKKRLSYSNKMIMQEALNQNSLNDMSLYIQRVIKYTLLFEGIGAILLLLVFIPKYGVITGIYYSVFHSISAFCNAGFDLLGSNSLIDYQSHLLMNMIITFLIISGGLGFVVWIELKDKIVKYIQKKMSVRKVFINLSLHSKIVLSTTLLLIFGGMFLFLALEYNNTLKELSLFDKILVSYFQSVTTRTAGFASVDMSILKDSTKFIMCILMFIGGSPAGTAGGLKTVTIAIIILSCISMVKGKQKVSVFNRTIPDIIVKRTLTFALISLFMTFVAVMILSISENKEFIDVLFEVYSAFATVGLTASLTPSLSLIGKIVIMILMYIGRIGPLTMMLLFVKKYNQLSGKEIEYPDGDVLIG